MSSFDKDVSLLLSGLFCCLGFLCVFLLFGRGRVLFFAVWAGPRPCPNSKKQNIRHPCPNSKNTLFAVWGGRGRGGYCFIFCCLGGGGMRFLLVAVWAGPCFTFDVWAGGVFCFCRLGGGVFVFWPFGRGREFTHLPACLAGL